MDFYADAVAVLEAIVRGLHGQDFLAGCVLRKEKNNFLRRKAELLAACE